MEIQDKIFVPFFTTRNNGSGIGLSLSRQLVRLLGGTLTFISKENDTVFTIKL
jgi:signal transduction histidine kinase